MAFDYILPQWNNDGKIYIRAYDDKNNMISQSTLYQYFSEVPLERNTRSDCFAHLFLTGLTIGTVIKTDY